MTSDDKTQLIEDITRALEPVLNKAIAPLLMKIRAQKGRLYPEDTREMDQICETIMEGVGNWAEAKAQELEKAASASTAPLTSLPSETGENMHHSNMR